MPPEPGRSSPTFAACHATTLRQAGQGPHRPPSSAPARAPEPCRSKRRRSGMPPASTPPSAAQPPPRMRPAQQKASDRQESRSGQSCILGASLIMSSHEPDGACVHLVDFPTIWGHRCQIVHHLQDVGRPSANHQCQETVSHQAGPLRLHGLAGSPRTCPPRPHARSPVANIRLVPTHAQPRWAEMSLSVAPAGSRACSESAASAMVAVFCHGSKSSTCGMPVSPRLGDLSIPECADECQRIRLQLLGNPALPCLGLGMVPPTELARNVTVLRIRTCKDPGNLSRSLGRRLPLPKRQSWQPPGSQHDRPIDCCQCRRRPERPRPVSSLVQEGHILRPPLPARGQAAFVSSPVLAEHQRSRGVTQCRSSTRMPSSPALPDASQRAYKPSRHSDQVCRRTRRRRPTMISLDSVRLRHEPLLSVQKWKRYGALDPGNKYLWRERRPWPQDDISHNCSVA